MKQVTQGANTYTFAYNGLGDRLSQTVGVTTTRYVLDPAAGLTQVLSDGTNTYLYGNGRIAQYQAEMQYFGADGLGSVRQFYDASGMVAANTRYDPYGSLMSHSGDATSVFGFTGEQWDAGTGLEYLRARYYSAAQGRFTTRDVWEGDYEEPLSLNHWNYGNGDPVNATDPSGHAIYRCDYSKSPPKCSVVRIYRGPTYSYTELMLLYFGLRPQAGTFSGMPDAQWYEDHVHEWNGDWGEIAPGDPYDPSAAEALTMQWALARRLGCDTSNMYLTLLGQTLGGLQFPAFGSDEGRFAGAAALRRARLGKGFVITGGNPLYRGGRTFEVRDEDIAIDKKTNLVKSTKGVSLNVDPAKVEKFGGAHMVESVPEGLMIIQRGMDPGHYEIVPDHPMPPDEYRGLVQKIGLEPY